MERQIDVQSPAILLLLAAFGLAAIFCPNRLPFTSVCRLLSVPFFLFSSELVLSAVV